jgi:hypothetical protein
LFAVQYPLLDLRMHWVGKFAISTLSTVALSFASYQLLVRHTPVGRLLAGKRAESPAPGTAALLTFR